MSYAFSRHVKLVCVKKFLIKLKIIAQQNQF